MRDKIAALMGKLFWHFHFSVMPETRRRQVNVFCKACFAENVLLQGKLVAEAPGLLYIIYILSLVVFFCFSIPLQRGKVQLGHIF